MAPSPSHRAVRVELGERSYDARIARGLLSSLGEITRDAINPSPRPRAFLVADEALPTHLVRGAWASLESAGFQVSSASLRASESSKTLSAAGSLLHAMTSARLERSDPLIALGGGVVGDVAGFAAAIHRRGIPLVHAPTTLLAMVDACIGGKTGVNAVRDDGRLAKNAIGAFHQPRAVVIDPAALDSLPPRYFHAGLAECVKHAMLGGACDDPTLFEWTERHARAILSREERVIVELIARNIALKARVVALDEREESDDPLHSRALLNLGHTFAHAVETLDGVSPDGDLRHAPLHHGEAVALGLLAATRCAVALNLSPPDFPGRVLNLVRTFNLPAFAHGLPGGEPVLDAMLDDKKTRASRLRLVLPTRVGHARVVEDPAREAVLLAVNSLRTPAHRG